MISCLTLPSRGWPGWSNIRNQHKAALVGIQVTSYPNTGDLNANTGDIDVNTGDLDVNTGDFG